MENYESARKLGRRQVAEAFSQGRYPYLPALDDMVSEGSRAGYRSLGVMEIPLSLVSGTCTRGRQNLFSWGFMPLAAPSSEFAVKWAALLRSQLEEGLREPIVCYEYLQHFYVMEGNKRVSVARFLDMPSIPAQVTRVMPEASEDDSYLLYQEFLRFYKAAPVYGLTFSRPGSFARLAKLYGKTLDEPWDEAEVKRLRSSYARFMKAFGKLTDDPHAENPADAFLVYLRTNGPDSLTMGNDELEDRLSRMRKELIVAVQDEPISFKDKLPDPKGGVREAIKGAAKSAAAATLGVKPVHLAFIYDRPVGESGWVGLHEKGRLDLESRMGNQVKTSVYPDCRDEESFDAAVRQALAAGADLVVTVSPRQFGQALRASVAHPKAKIINCSINLSSSSVRSFYARMYEVKFIMGALAASVTESHRIGYVAVSPIYGAVSEIDAFALGAAMVDPKARIQLEWISEKDSDWRRKLLEGGADVIAGIDYPDPTGENGPHGLNRVLPDGSFEQLATAVWDWGWYYEMIVRSLRDSSWKHAGRETGKQATNYWLGIREGAVRLELADTATEGQRRLTRMLGRAIVEGTSPFDGVFLERDGLKESSQERLILSDERIAAMRWLASNVDGRLPVQSELNDAGKRVVDAAGVIAGTGPSEDA